LERQQCAAGSPMTVNASVSKQIFRGVTFTPDAAGNPKIFGTVKKTNSFVITRTALLDQNYAVKWSVNLNAANWTRLTNLTSILTGMTVTDATMFTDTNRFYRVVLNP
jgi:hypothetical protein